ncbi:MAG: hypothetical protein LBJ17_05065, partial [Dysgonamonadaceae bacterium]|nr:hypothetical protein [Dysgonamonadaceae bacterium]
FGRQISEFGRQIFKTVRTKFKLKTPKKVLGKPEKIFISPQQKDKPPEKIFGLFNSKYINRLSVTRLRGGRVALIDTFFHASIANF